MFNKEVVANIKYKGKETTENIAYERTHAPCINAFCSKDKRSRPDCADGCNVCYDREYNPN